MNNRILMNLRSYLGNNVSLEPSTRKNKKWMLKRPDGSYVHFGDSRYEDFTQHQNEERRKRYLARSGKIIGNWRNDPYSPNNMSINILWK